MAWVAERTRHLRLTLLWCGGLTVVAAVVGYFFKGGAGAAGAAIGVALPFSWLGGFLGFIPLPPAYWIALCLILISYVTLTHFVKTWFIRRFGLS